MTHIKCSHYWLLWIALGLLLPLPSAGQASQEANSPANQSRESGSTAILTSTIAVAVTDGKGEPVADLKAGDFSLSEGGKPLSITSVALNDAPACIGLILDKSGSMRHKLSIAVGALMDFVRAGNSADQFFVVDFNDDAYLDQDFTADQGRIEEALTRHDARGGTALYDAVWASASHLEEKATCRRKALLVLTDGGDNSSRKSLARTTSALQKMPGLSLYIVNISDYDPNVHASRSALEALAASVNGQVVFVGLGKMDKILRTMALALRDQYLITYQRKDTTGQSGSGMLNVAAHAQGHKDLHVKIQGGTIPSSSTEAAK